MHTPVKHTPVKLRSSSEPTRTGAPQVPASSITTAASAQAAPFDMKMAEAQLVVWVLRGSSPDDQRARAKCRNQISDALLNGERGVIHIDYAGDVPLFGNMDIKVHGREAVLEPEVKSASSTPATVTVAASTSAPIDKLEHFKKKLDSTFLSVELKSADSLPGACRGIVALVNNSGKTPAEKLDFYSSLATHLQGLANDPSEPRPELQGRLRDALDVISVQVRILSPAPGDSKEAQVQVLQSKNVLLGLLSKAQTESCRKSTGPVARPSGDGAEQVRASPALIPASALHADATFHPAPLAPLEAAAARPIDIASIEFTLNAWIEGATGDKDRLARISLRNKISDGVLAGKTLLNVSYPHQLPDLGRDGIDVVRSDHSWDQTAVKIEKILRAIKPFTESSQDAHVDEYAQACESVLTLLNGVDPDGVKLKVYYLTRLLDTIDKALAHCPPHLQARMIAITYTFWVQRIADQLIALKPHLPLPGLADEWMQKLVDRVMDRIKHAVDQRWPQYEAPALQPVSNDAGAHRPALNP